MMCAEFLQHPGVQREEFRQNPSALPSACFRGAFESYRRALVRSTEATDAYHFIVFATVAGLIVGRRAYLHHGRFLFPNCYACLVGPTGRSRKSTAVSYGRQLLAEVDTSIEIVATSSWEGLLEVLDAGELHSRALMNPGEFKTLAMKAKQDACSTLVSGLTELYDCPPSYRHKTRAKNLDVKRPFLSILTSSTPEWFHESIDTSAVAGGFLNRWVFVDGNPKPPNPFPEPPGKQDWDSAVRGLRELDRRLKDYPIETGLRLELAPAAREIWADFYSKALSHDYGSELLAKMGERLQDVALRTAMLYALLEGADVVDKETLEAGILFAKWQRRCHKRVLEGLGDNQQKKLEDRILELLDEYHANSVKPKKRELQQRTRGRHVSAYDFNRAFRALDQAGEISIDPETKCVERLNRVERRGSTLEQP